MRFLPLFLISCIIFANSCWAEKKTLYRLPQENNLLFQANEVEYLQKENFFEAKGQVTLYYGEYKIIADRLIYDITLDQVWAEGNINFTDQQNRVFIGDSIIFKNKFKKGIISQFSMSFAEDTIISGVTAYRLDQDHTEFDKIIYTPCPLCQDHDPQWQIKANKVSMDAENEKIIYRNALFEIYGVPVFYLPYFSHPMPGASAHSGFLMPSFHNKSIRIPFYYRIKPNMDTTITPRIYAKNIMFEGEFRHLLKKGDYQINASFIKSKNNKLNAAKMRYHIFSSGNFRHNNLLYGYEFNRTSDKSYLKNYDISDESFLRSKIYVNNINEHNYNAFEALYFQGLRQNDSKKTDPLVMPNIGLRRTYWLNDKGSNLILENHLMSYNTNIQQFSRNSLMVAINNSYNYYGNIFDLTAYFRGDLYKITKNKIVSQNKKDTAIASPEIHLGWRYPLYRNFNLSSMIIEPVIFSVISPNNHFNYDNFLNTDSQNMELSEENIFHNNRFSGLDRHEYGTRISYGIKAYLNRNNDLFNFFIGQIYRPTTKMSLPLSSGMSGEFSNVLIKTSWQRDNLDLYYKMRLTPQKLNLQRNELGIIYNYNNLFDWESSFALIKNNDQDLTSKKKKQLYSRVNFHINDEWSVFGNIRLDFKKINTSKVLENGIGLMYHGPCVKITAKLSSDFTGDNKRNISKKKNYGFTIGLKTLK